MENKKVNSIYGELSYAAIINSFVVENCDGCFDVWVHRLKEQGVVDLTDEDMANIISMSNEYSMALRRDAVEFSNYCAKHRFDCSCDCYVKYDLGEI